MDTCTLLSHNPLVKTAWYKVNGVRVPRFGVADADTAETVRLELLADAEAKEQAAQQRRDAWDAKRAAEWIAQKIARAAALPNATAFLAFCKLCHHKETIPFLDEIRAEFARLDEEERAALDGEGGLE